MATASPTHGDSAIYETMVRLTKDNEALLVPFVDSEGNFGKYYSREMAYAASRYTEVKLEGICQEIFADIDKDTVSFIDNYDGSMKEPALLPTTFPNILANPNLGIAVGMASSICSFNLAELCEATAQYIKDDTVDLCEVLSAPDFSTGGELIYSRKDLEQIYKTAGAGCFCVGEHFVRHAVRGDDLSLKRNAELLEDLAGVAHDIPIGGRTHNDKASIAATIFVPVILYGLLMVTRLLKDDSKDNS